MKDILSRLLLSQCRNGHTNEPAVSRKEKLLLSRRWRPQLRGSQEINKIPYTVYAQDWTDATTDSRRLFYDGGLNEIHAVYKWSHTVEKMKNLKFNPGS